MLFMLSKGQCEYKHSLIILKQKLNIFRASVKSLVGDCSIVLVSTLKKKHAKANTNLLKLHVTEVPPPPLLLKCLSVIKAADLFPLSM